MVVAMIILAAKDKIVRRTVSQITDQEGGRYTERRSTYRQREGTREPCEPIPSWCLASTHVKGNAVNLCTRKREKGSHRSTKKTEMTSL